MKKKNDGRFSLEFAEKSFRNILDFLESQVIANDEGNNKERVYRKI